MFKKAQLLLNGVIQIINWHSSHHMNLRSKSKILINMKLYASSLEGGHSLNELLSSLIKTLLNFLISLIILTYRLKLCHVRLLRLLGK